jgi:hypothetical protein
LGSAHEMKPKTGGIPQEEPEKFDN